MTRTYADERARELLAAERDAVIAEMEAQYGPGCSNGVAAIMLHDSLPETFTRDNWKAWFFKPATGAFDWAIDHKLIEPVAAWRMTPLGTAVSERMQPDGDQKSTPQPDSDPVEKVARALAADHYGERFKKPVDDQQVAANVDANWNIYAGQARVALAAIRTLSTSPSGIEGDDWRCPDCRCRTYAQVSEQQPDGTFAPGPKIRCVNCKRVYGPSLSDAREALTKAAAAFRMYEQSHQEKADEAALGLSHGEYLSRITKAERNRSLAEMCESASSKIGADHG